MKAKLTALGRHSIVPLKSTVEIGIGKIHINKWKIVYKKSRRILICKLLKSYWMLSLLNRLNVLTVCHTQSSWKWKC